MAGRVRERESSGGGCPPERPGPKLCISILSFFRNEDVRGALHPAFDCAAFLPHLEYAAIVETTAKPDQVKHS